MPAIINAARSEQQGVRLTGLTRFRFDNDTSSRSGSRRRQPRLKRPLGCFKSVRVYARRPPASRTASPWAPA